jgi:hypothetical protein
MPRKRNWVDSFESDAAEIVKGFQAGVRELRQETVARSTEMRVAFNKQWRKMIADMDARRAEFDAQIVQYEYDAKGNPRDEAVRAAREQLQRWGRAPSWAGTTVVYHTHRFARQGRRRQFPMYAGVGWIRRSPAQWGTWRACC